MTYAGALLAHDDGDGNLSLIVGTWGEGDNLKLAADEELCDCVCGEISCCDFLYQEEPGRQMIVTFEGYEFPDPEWGARNDTFTIQFEFFDGEGGCRWTADFEPSLSVSILRHGDGKIELTYAEEETVWRWELDPAECDDMVGPTVLDEVNVPPGGGSATIELGDLPD